MSFSKVYAAQISGLHADIITIEVDLSNGLHAFSIVGLGDRAVEEAKDRISSAIKNSGFISPKQRNQKVVIGLAPADIKKEGTTFDFGMAVGYLLASGNIDFNPEKKIFIGELSLEGNVHRARGTLAMIRAAQKKGFECAFVAAENAEESGLISNIIIYPIHSLLEFVAHISGNKKIIPQPRTKIMANTRRNNETSIDFADIHGQEHAKRALEIAAAGRHNIAMYGPPGTGKTMLAKAFVGILPNLSYTEALEVTELYSMITTSSVITRPPFRSPHHTSPYSAIIGGGLGSPKPGEITLAHRGVLFLDEFTEFDRRTIDSLRQPMEEKKITITRTKESITYPADCIYILAMNPCACGGKKCVCTEKEIIRYRKKISGPIADRIDIWISVSKIKYEKFSTQQIGDKSTTGNTSESISARIKQARLFGKKLRLDTETSLEGAAFLLESARKFDLSGRAHVRTTNVARTIANLAQSETIKKEHIMEALQYRMRDL